MQRVNVELNIICYCNVHENGKKAASDHEKSNEIELQPYQWNRTAKSNEYPQQHEQKKNIENMHCAQTHK